MFNSVLLCSHEELVFCSYSTHGFLKCPCESDRAETQGLDSFPPPDNISLQLLIKAATTGTAQSTVDLFQLAAASVRFCHRLRTSPNVDRWKLNVVSPNLCPGGMCSPPGMASQTRLDIGFRPECRRPSRQGPMTHLQPSGCKRLLQHCSCADVFGLPRFIGSFWALSGRKSKSGLS